MQFNAARTYGVFLFNRLLQAIGIDESAEQRIGYTTQIESDHTFREAFTEFTSREDWGDIKAALLENYKNNLIYAKIDARLMGKDTDMDEHIGYEEATLKPIQELTDALKEYEKSATPASSPPKKS